MTITREQIAELRAGDIVRVTGWDDLTVEGPVTASSGSLWLGGSATTSACHSATESP